MLNVSLVKADDILNTNYKNNKELNEKEIEDIAEEYDSENIKNTLDKGNILQQFEIFFSGDNENILIACNLFSLNKDNDEFVSFLCSDHGQNILIENNLSIHIETGNIFFDNFNTNENFYDFLMNQQDEKIYRQNNFLPSRI